MGLLDTVLGSLMGGAAGGSSSPMGGVLSSLLGGGGQAAGGMGAQGGMGGMAGGLGGLMSQFEQAGLGHVAQSWVSNGPNQGVSPEQLQSVFGANQVQGMASQAGMQPHDFLAQLSQHLPNAVHGMTPNGQLPDEGTMSV
ncbi:MAG: YidB family protein [Janthinobacterium lividum]